MRRIGVLTPLAESDPEGQARIGALRQALASLGWAEGRNIQIDYHWSAEDADHLRVNAAKLAGMAPDVIVVNSTVMLAALKKETQTVPIVFVQVPDPVASGLVASLAHPGGNITGFTIPSMRWVENGWSCSKRSCQTSLGLRHIQNPRDRSSSEYTRAIKAVAPSVGVQVTAADPHDASEIERSIGTFERESNAGLIVLPGVFTFVHHKVIIAMAARHHLPAVYPYRYHTADGGLISYGVETVDLYRRAAGYVDRILKGEIPAGLPVQAPNKSSLSLISGPPRRSASPCRRGCSPAPTK